MAFYNVSKIENWFDDFTSCKNKFINTYYDDYQDSYIRTCNDEIIRKMKTQLDNHYNKIKRIYNRINDHWSNYLNDLKNIDNCIAGTSNPFSVYAPAPAAKLNSLPCLKEYEANLATKIESFSGYIGTVTFLGWSEDKDTSENLLYIFERTGATVGTAVVSVIEGIGMFGEGIVDVCTTVVSECYCQVRLAVDDDFTEKQADIIRESTRDVVSTQYVKNKFDSFYQESDVGAYLSENAYAFDAVRSIGNEVGIVVGAVVVSSLTQGAIPPSVLYGISKAGNHIEENFQDENNGYFESIVKGGLAGALDGVFFAAGAKGDQVLKATIGKSAAKNLFAFGGKMGYEAFCAVSQDGSNIVLDSLFMDNQIVDNNGNTIYFENYKDKLSYCYEQAGGKEAIIESLVTSVVLSGMSDGVDTIKAVRNIDAGSAIKNIDVSSSSIDTNASGISKQIDGISSKTSVFDDVEINGVNIDSNTAVKNMDINSSSMGTNTSKISKQIDEVTSKTSIFNEENIAALNNKIAKDNFVGIKVDSEADIPDDIWERISRPKNDKDVWITTADGKKYYWGEDVHPRMLEGNEVGNSLETRITSDMKDTYRFDKVSKSLDKLDISLDERNKICESLCTRYKKARINANGKYNKTFRSYRDHGELHVLEVAEYSKQMAQKNVYLNDSAAMEVYFAGLTHDLGMEDSLVIMNPKTKIVETVSEISGGMVRKNHSLNSAIAVLQDGDKLLPKGMDIDKVALLTLTHGKSTSGIKDFSNKEMWIKAIDNLDSASKKLGINFDSDRMKNVINNPKTFKEIQEQATCLRDGDAMSKVPLDADGKQLMQTGQSVTLVNNNPRKDFNDIIKEDSKEMKYNEDGKLVPVETALEREMKDISDVLSSGEKIDDTLGKAYHIGENNVRFESNYTGEGKYVAHVYLNDANNVPNASAMVISERVGEINTYGNIKSRKMIVHLPKGAENTKLGDFYKNFNYGQNESVKIVVAFDL